MRINWGFELYAWILDIYEFCTAMGRTMRCKVSALDLTAPASDALLKNRKNAWIQLAGHPGSFAPAGPNTIWKKRITKENYETKTYEALMDDPNTESIIPCFYREVEYNAEFFIEIEDLLQHFNDPNIMDIKMGKRTFLESEVKNAVLRKDLYEKMIALDPNAPTTEERENQAITKLRYMQFREQESSTADLGFRIDAIRMSGEMPHANLKKTKSKEQVSCVVRQFLGSSKALPVICRRLRDIRHRFECSKFFTTHEIIGSSLLIMYDKQDKSGVWMIDFAKTIPIDAGMVLNHRSPWQLGNHEDGYLNGMDSLIEVCEGLLKEQSTSVENERTET
ncbi:inositol-trisphosphate 3-kinase homolog isoform X2 [Gigantopelta aegis]|uniref:inositol-trisphosphate 3-kinase homolog isoform X2 n=1 Tax=Gigantopelta aegis TaxID=1735272 RepID=UPI001B888661|nr:inositol-trisphosphate 3-kinase homolog isoform X2 [Gigantopelta aegis]